MTLSLSREFPMNLYLGSSYAAQQPWPTYRLSSNRFKRYLRNKRQSSRLLGKSLHKRSLLNAVSTNNYSKRLKLSIPTMSDLWVRRLWFLHNALPLAVQLKPTKPNTLYKMELNATLPLKLWVGQKGIQFLEKVTESSLQLSFKNRHHQIWSFVQALDCYTPIVLTRLGFVSRPAEGKFWTKHNEVRKNGFVLNSGWNPMFPADIMQNQKQILNFWSNKLNPVQLNFPKSIYNS